MYDCVIRETYTAEANKYNMKKIHQIDVCVAGESTFQTPVGLSDFCDAIIKT